MDKSSLYAQYLKEREDKEILENEFGFVTYKFLNATECYIHDIFVIPEMRESGLAMQMKQDVIDIAKSKGCQTLIGSVCTSDSSASRNLKILLNDKWQIHATNGNMIFVNKSIVGDI
jgi:predicted GNAT family acetyltransferase